MADEDSTSKPVAVVDSGSLVSMAMVKGRDGRTPLSHLSENYEVHAPYEVIAEVNAMAADPNGQLRRSGQERVRDSARSVMANADDVFDGIHVQSKFGDSREDTMSRAEKHDVAADSVDKKLIGLDAITGTAFGDESFSRQDAFEMLTDGKHDNENDMRNDPGTSWDAGEAVVTGLTVQSNEGDGLDTMGSADVVFCDDDKTRSSVQNFVGDDVPVATTGDFLGGLARSESTDVTKEDAVDMINGIAVTRNSWATTEHDTVADGLDGELGNFIQNMYSGAIAQNPEFTEEELDDLGVEEGGLTNAGRSGVGKAKNRGGGGGSGTIIEKMVRCGKSSCSTCPHGPYAYGVWSDGSRTIWNYVGRA